jgi:selenocysteine-specific elongation factor
MPSVSETPVSAATRLAVVGTAGHIDHGKTAMVRRLTGVDTDRLPEEKKRGISIDLGFAPLITPAGVRVGIVDVPGHERFVKNMLSGVGGIDLVLLVIAADEGVMPQTREHLAIVKLLGIARGIVVLTKSDLVDKEWIDLVTRDVRALLAATPFAEAPIVSFSATTGAGQAELLAEMDRQLASLPGRSSDDATRLPVDRVFTVEGFGTVVTGTLWRGRVRTGDVLTLEPGGREVRVRRVQVHGATVDEAAAGQRTAVAIHGADRQQIARGVWLTAPGSLRGSTTLDVRFELLEDVPRAWPRIARVRFHLGASEIIGRLTLLGTESLEPGQSALAQLRLERPAVAARGDRFVIRSYSPSRTVGGGSVIEPVAARRRRHAGGLEQLAVFESGSIEARLLQRLSTETKMISTAEIARLLSETEAATLGALHALRSATRILEPVSGRWLTAERWSAVRESIEREVRTYAERYPARYGITKGDLKSGLKTSIDAALFDAAFDALVREAALEQRGERVRPAGAPWEPPAATLSALERIESELNATGLSVPDNATWSAKLGAAAAEATALGFFLGRLVRVSQDYTYTSAQMEGLESKLAEFLARKPTLNVAEFKELAGVSRKWAVPLLEHSDRVGWTARSGDERKAGPRLS